MTASYQDLGTMVLGSNFVTPFDAYLVSLKIWKVHLHSPMQRYQVDGGFLCGWGAGGGGEDNL